MKLIRVPRTLAKTLYAIIHNSMKYEDFTKVLKDQIAVMPQSNQVNFALKICKELFFDYQQFYEIYEWGNPDILLDAINLCEKVIRSSSEIGQVKDFLLKVESATPDMDDFGSEIASCALNASTAVYETLQFLIDNNKIHINNIATYYADTAYFKIQETKVLTTEEIDNHPLTIKIRTFLLAETT